MNQVSFTQMSSKKIIHNLFWTFLIKKSLKFTTRPTTKMTTFISISTTTIKQRAAFLSVYFIRVLRICSTHYLNEEFEPIKSSFSKLQYPEKSKACLVGWDYRIHRLHLCNECFGYDTKQSDGEVPVMLGLWGIWSTPSLPLLPGPLWPGVVAPDRALSMG